MSGAARHLITREMYAARARACRYDLARKFLLVAAIGCGATLAAAPGWPRVDAALALLIVTTASVSVICEQQARDFHRNADAYRKMVEGSHG